MSKGMRWKTFRAQLHRLLMRWGMDTRKRRRDRVVLETIILPSIHRDPSMQKILFVGCAWYTLHYPWMFQDRDFRTLEIDPAAAKYGAPCHIIGSCEAMDSYFQERELDCIVMNGVFGFGLDTPDALNRSILGMHRALREGGLLVFGWNDLPAHAPFPPGSVSAWKFFRPVLFPALGVSTYHSDPINQHRFEFYANHAGLSDPAQG